ncbi:hypothetical protein GUJ93_ZPchr0013g36960 [Zizania palustris]|uniref:Strictosidine synthase conserved region domain-containing protein n=1 Tax=Zizania palustris TaxID=103762 RepID=A0A8J5X0W6_ZIZPA|nr:hypothetical protein GUJ93_ZPchr0013g36960 [Zizania palustris]
MDATAEYGEDRGRTAELAGGRVRRRRRRAVHGDEGRVGAADARERFVGAVGLRRRHGTARRRAVCRRWRHARLRRRQGIVESRGEWTGHSSCFGGRRLDDQVGFFSFSAANKLYRLHQMAGFLCARIVRFADAAIEASDGTVYFSDATTRFTFANWYLDFLESRFSGRLLKYDPRTGKASVVLGGLGFANGVALPADESFVVVCESMRFRCLKVWLKGEKAGQAEIFVDNLPGCPDNIRLGSDGYFWIALLQLRSSPWVELINRWTLTKKVVASFPALLEWSKATLKGAMVAQVSQDDGQIMRVLDDSQGKVVRFITSVTEFNGDLFFGSLDANFVGKLSLAKVPHDLQDAVSS